jgi:hypothetical protein
MNRQRPSPHTRLRLLHVMSLCVALLCAQGAAAEDRAVSLAPSAQPRHVYMELAAGPRIEAGTDAGRQDDVPPGRVPEATPWLRVGIPLLVGAGAMILTAERRGFAGEATDEDLRLARGLSWGMVATGTVLTGIGALRIGGQRATGSRVLRPTVVSVLSSVLLAGGAAATVAGFYWGACFSGEYCINS